jgi:exopolysaccharide biosynthesis polyprenyl glycosylphosphotransferase
LTPWGTLSGMARPEQGRRAPLEPPPAPPSPQPRSPAPAPTPIATAPPQHRLVFLPPDWLPVALLAGDAILVTGAVLVGYWYRHNLDPIRQQGGEALQFGPYLVAIPFVIALYLFALALTHQYVSWRGRTLTSILLDLYAGIGLAAILMLAVISIANLGVYFSRLTITYTILVSAVLLTTERYALRQYETRLRRKGIGTERVLMVGTGIGSEMLIQRMNMFPQYGYQVVGVAADHLEGGAFAGVPVVGPIDRLPELVDQLKVNQVFLALPGGDRAKLLKLIKLCEDRQLEFKIVPDLLDVMSTRVDVNAIDGVPLVGIRRTHLSGVNAVIKRTIDVVVSAIALVIVSPLLLVTSLLVKLTSPRGPVLFRQERIGRQRRPFVVYKFRTMIPNAETNSGPVVAKPGDPRATPLGRFLRRSSIDELPQLINILKGDMSLVGPRPQPTFFDEKYSADVPRYLERQQVRPGLTGWAEVNDLRGAAPIVDRTMYDAYYVENWSLALDLKILLLTGLRLFFQRHAY